LTLVGAPPAFLVAMASLPDPNQPPVPQQTVDDLPGALEIRRCSSYVPSLMHGVLRGFPEDADANGSGAVMRLEQPIWMK